MRAASRWLVGLAALCFSTNEALAQTSKLWGEAGELWSPESRLPDFSHAGYHDGEAPIPDVPVVTTVADFGAVGDGVTDDTAAFLAAIAATQNGALLVPKGRYLLTGQLPIDKSDVVLRGEGSGADGTILYFTKSLTDILGAAPQWSWYGGLIQVRPPSPSRTALTTITAAATRGSTTVSVADASAVSAGDNLVIYLVDDGSGTLGQELHNNLAASGDCTYQVPLTLELVVRVAAVSGNQVTLTQPLRIDIDPTWKPELASFQKLTEVGFEHLAVEFVPTDYAGHLLEPGYNAISFNDGVMDSWVRDVRIRDSDSGILADTRVAHVSVLGLALEGRRGHHGLNLSFVSDWLVQDFHIDNDWIHALTLDHRSHGVVFSRGAGSLDMALDHHRDSPFENLFTEVTPYNFASGGNTCAGPHAGARNTYWSLGPSMVVPLFWGGIQSTVVGPLTVSEKLTDEQEWYEYLAAPDPPNLHEAQLAARLCPADPPSACQQYVWDVASSSCIVVDKNTPDCGGTGGGSSVGAGGNGSGAGGNGSGASGGGQATGGAGNGADPSVDGGCAVGGSGTTYGGAWLVVAGAVLAHRRRRLARRSG